MKEYWRITPIETEPYENSNLICPLLAWQQKIKKVLKSEARVVQPTLGWGNHTHIIEIAPHNYALAH